jgi:hypothetical protein
MQVQKLFTSTNCMLKSSIDEDLHLYNAMFKVLWLKKSEPKLMLGKSWLSFQMQVCSQKNFANIFCQLKENKEHIDLKSSYVEEIIDIKSSFNVETFLNS